METIYPSTLQAGVYSTNVTLRRGIGWGMIGGLTGTMLMDLLLMGGLIAAGLPALSCFSIVGETVARFFSLLGIQLAGFVPLGVVTHYLVGPLVGAIFGAAISRFAVLQVNSLKKGIAMAVIYVEIISQPVLITTPLLLKMTAAETLQWFGISFAMHLLVGVVLGTFVSFKLRSIETAPCQ